MILSLSGKSRQAAVAQPKWATHPIARRDQQKARATAMLAATDHELTVIIPAYNERFRLPRSLSTLAAYLGATRIDYRVLIADDGSTDGTASLTNGYGPRFSTLRLEHGGKGHAVRKAMLSATGQVLAFTDADLPYDLGSLAQGYYWIHDNQCEVVLGMRRPAEATAHVSRRRIRALASLAFNEVVRRVVAPEMIDTQCGLKFFSRRAATEIFSRSTLDGFAFDAEAVLLALRLGLTYRRLPVTLVNESSSTVSLWRDALPMLRDVVKIRMRLGRRPLTPLIREGWGRLQRDLPRLAA